MRLDGKYVLFISLTKKIQFVLPKNIVYIFHERTACVCFQVRLIILFKLY